MSSWDEVALCAFLFLPSFPLSSLWLSDAELSDAGSEYIPSVEPKGDLFSLQPAPPSTAQIQVLSPLATLPLPSPLSHNIIYHCPAGNR